MNTEAKKDNLTALWSMQGALKRARATREIPVDADGFYVNIGETPHHMATVATTRKVIKAAMDAALAKRPKVSGVSMPGWTVD